MRYFSDTDGNLDLKSALQRFRRGEVSKLNGSEQFSLPYSTSIYWVAFNITNQQDVPAFLHPTANQPFFRLLEFYVIRPDCSVQLVLDHQQATPYRAEEFYGPNLTGRPFRIDAAETVTFVLRYGSYGFTFLPLSLETPQSIERVANAAETRVAIFYTLALTALTSVPCPRISSGTACTVTTYTISANPPPMIAAPMMKKLKPMNSTLNGVVPVAALMPLAFTCWN